MSKLYSDFLDYVLPDVPGCSLPLAVHEIRNACIEFCNETQCYEHDHAAIDVVAGQRDYSFTLPTGTVVAAIKTAKVSGDEIYSQSNSQLDDRYLVYGIDWRDTTVTGDVEFYQATDPSMSGIRLVLAPAAAETGGLVVSLALKPSASSASVPDWLFDQYREAIAHGSKAKLFAMAKKPWTSGDLSSYHKGMFESAKGNADTATAKGFTRAPLRVKGHNR